MCFSNLKFTIRFPTCVQDTEGFVFHYWALFDGHAGSGAAVVASRLLQHHIACQLQAVIDVLRKTSSPPPTVLGEEPDGSNPYLQGNTPGSHRALTRAASMRGATGTPGSPSSTPPPPRFFNEKKIEHESLVVGAIENAFKEMVRGATPPVSHLIIFQFNFIHTVSEVVSRRLTHRYITDIKSRSQISVIGYVAYAEMQHSMNNIHYLIDILLTSI